MKKVLMSGNEACGEGAMIAGCRFYAGYPITPQNELTEYMARRMPETGGVFIQSESEVAAINMVFGASLTGARAMTSSSSPGISLKQEGISYMAACELPAVIINMVRGGPGLGNIAPAQSDYFQATKGGGHGDYHLIVLGPSSAQEMMELTVLAFDLADKYRTPVLILGDGLIGQMMEPVLVNSRQSLVVSKKLTTKNWVLTGCKGRDPRIVKSLWLNDGALEAFNRKLGEKYEHIKRAETRYEAVRTEDADIVFVGYGSVARILRAAVARLREEGIRAGLLRPITLWPFPQAAIRQLSKKTKKFVVVEMSMGQMLEDVELAVAGNAKIEFYGRPGGGIPHEEEIYQRVIARHKVPKQSKK
ncbi:MAG: 3-methyl-2-oxobutanoate dehydrogenase subunit VorB [Candidatus Omnitrophica bacterium]|nr:3-methyl-2-oxobutanoate dehydrogenase subunit VorB [Candidatus Omnitrophota bacterium]